MAFGGGGGAWSGDAIPEFNVLVKRDCGWSRVFQQSVRVMHVRQPLHPSTPRGRCACAAAEVGGGSRATSNLAQGIFILRIACLLGLDYRLWASRPPVGRRQRAPTNRMSGVCLYVCVWMWVVDDEVVQSADVCTCARKRYNRTLSRIISHRVGVMCKAPACSSRVFGQENCRPSPRMALGHRWGADGVALCSLLVWLTMLPCDGSRWRFLATTGQS